MIKNFTSKSRFMVTGLLVAAAVVASSTVLPATNANAAAKYSAVQAAPVLPNKEFKKVFKAIKKSRTAAGTYNYNATSRADLLAAYGLTKFSSIIYTDDFSPLPADFYSGNKSKVYLHTWHEDGHTFVDIAHWSKKKQLWVGYEMSDLGINRVVWGEHPPYVG